MNILITHPEFEGKGGVSNLYLKLKGKFKILVLHFIVGRRRKEKKFFQKIFRLFQDYFKFLICLKRKNIDLVHVNPSLDWQSIIRDGLFVLLSKIKKKKIIVFFHGWSKSSEKIIDYNFVWLFKFFFGKSDTFIVLAEDFRKTLKRWGISQPIYKLINVISEDEIAGFNIQDAIKKRQRSERWRVLFLSRIVKDKGIYETVKSMSILENKHSSIELIVAGDGEELENVKSFVHTRKISNVFFAGYVSGEKKRYLFENSHILCLPTYHGEGLPLSVVEAMAYGLPVVTRPVGGLADFFKDGVHGFITESIDPATFANFIERLFLDKKLYYRISLNNYKYARSHFLPSDAVKRLESIYRSIFEVNKR